MEAAKMLSNSRSAFHNEIPSVFYFFLFLLSVLLLFIAFIAIKKIKNYYSGQKIDVTVFSMLSAVLVVIGEIAGVFIGLGMEDSARTKFGILHVGEFFFSVMGVVILGALIAFAISYVILLLTKKPIDMAKEEINHNKIVNSIYENYKSKETEELLTIYSEGKGGDLTDEALTAIKKVLSERGEDITV